MKAISEGNNSRISLDHLYVNEQSPLLTVDDLGERQIIHVGRCLLDQRLRLKNVLARDYSSLILLEEL